MKTALKMFFWWTLPAPKVGERYKDDDHLDDPWDNNYLDIIEQRGKWYRCRTQSGYECSKTRYGINLLYTKIGDPSVPAEKWPWEA